jgi:hypothetical protein
MADATALERRNGSTAQYQASWIEHPVRYVSHRIKPVTLLPCLLVAQRQFISSSSFRNHQLIISQLNETPE